jgi:enoyl-CoA hydratase|tara:strand:- start:4441 stop:5397 length:957 start_codon:yes stop_codon:yes gene_type:complete
MPDQTEVSTDELETLEIRSANWYAKELKYTMIIYEVNTDTHVATITLNRPEKMNAMSHQLRAELFHALKHSERRPDINVIVIKGAGRCFSAGYDLGGMGADEPDLGSQFVDTCGNTHWARYVVQQWFQLWDLSKLVIAQIHGYCLAGASELASMCDLLVTTPDCQIGYPPMRSMGVDMLWFPWLLPMRKATEMAVTGDNITGEEAYRLGMANYCVPGEDIDEFTEVFAERIALMSWQMSTQYKRAIKKAYEIQGIKTALDGQALFAYHRAGDSDYAREMSEKFRTIPLKEYFSLRDDPYRDNKAVMDEILARGKEKTG